MDAIIISDIKRIANDNPNQGLIQAKVDFDDHCFDFVEHEFTGKLYRSEHNELHNRSKKLSEYLKRFDEKITSDIIKLIYKAIEDILRIDPNVRSVFKTSIEYTLPKN